MFAASNQPPPVLAIALLVAVVAVVIGVSALLARRRREALRTTAATLGFEFDPATDPTCAGGRFGAIDAMQRGRNRQTFNHLRGRIVDCPITVCDYRYVTGSGKNRHTHHYGLVLVELPAPFPEVRVRSERWFDKIAAAVGYDDVDLPEQPEFSRRFHVSARDRDAARAFLESNLIEFLLRNDRYNWEIDGTALAIYRLGRFRPEDVGPAVEAAAEFVRIVTRRGESGASTARVKETGPGWFSDAPT